MADALHCAEIMKTIEPELLARAHGGAGLFAKPGAPKLAGELFPNGPIPHAEWTTWGSKTAGQPPPPLGDPSGIHYTFWGRPARDAIVVSGPRGLR
jgi:hypothetical protein